MTDEKFFAWLDGELEPAEAAEMESKVAADPELSRLAEQHRALSNELRSAFDPIVGLPVPEHLREALRPKADVIDFAVAKRARMPSIPQWTALAATLAVGILVGTMVPQHGSAPVEVHGGKIYAAAALSQALDTELASAPTREVRMGLTFRDRAGEICRSFTQSASSGLPGPSSGRWKIRGLLFSAKS